MPCEIVTVLAIDDGAAGGAGIGLVGDDGLKGRTEKIDMFIVH